MLKLSILTPVWNQEKLVIRTLDSIPRREDIEVIVRDDGSTDRTYAELRSYAEKTDLNLKVHKNSKNLGVAATCNRLLKSAKGEYFHFLMSDDYAYTAEYSKLIDILYTTDADVVCMNLQQNDDSILKLTPETEDYYCAQACRFIKKVFVEGITYHEDIRVGEDAYFHRDMKERNPKTIYTDILAYHYNYPREGSLIWNAIHNK